MMKENADIIILELADREVPASEATEMVDQLFTNMNNTYDRFVHGGAEQHQTDKPQKNRSSEESKESKESTAKQAGKKKLTEDDARENLSRVEESLKEDSEDEGELDDYVDAEKLLTDEEQSEIDDFRSVEVQLEEGQSEISDF